MDKKVFNRVEKKFLITPAQKEILLDLVEKNMRHDDYFNSSILNIYFDTDNYDLIIQSIDKPIFKEKLRARSYERYDKVFFEIKTKVYVDDMEAKVGFKRRVLVSRADYKRIVSGQASILEVVEQNNGSAVDKQIAKEMDYLINYFDLKPKILVLYKRTSFKDDSGLRLTFDEDLSYRDFNVKFSKTAKDKIYFNEEEANIVLELKSNGAIPLWLVRCLSENKIFQQPFSKIGRIYERIRKENNV